MGLLQDIGKGLGEIFGVPQMNAQSNLINQQAALTGLISDQYSDYVPQMNGLLWQMAQNTPGWLAAAINNQRMSMQQGIQGQVSQTGQNLQSSGMMSSGQANNLMAGVQTRGLMGLAGLEQQGQQAAGEYNLNALRLLAQNTVPGAGNALNSMAGLSGAYGEQAQQAIETLGTVGKIFANI